MSNYIVAKRQRLRSLVVTIVATVVLIPLGFVGFRFWDRLPWIEAAAYIHSPRGSIDCGNIVEPDYLGAQAAIDCAISAYERRHPFRVVFTVQGIDEGMSNAVIGDSRAKLIEIWYATGMFVDHDKLMRHKCDVPGQLLPDPAKIYHIPRLHCAPWPPAESERDHLFW